MHAHAEVLERLEVLDAIRLDRSKEWFEGEASAAVPVNPERQAATHALLRDGLMERGVPSARPFFKLTDDGLLAVAEWKTMRHGFMDWDRLARLLKMDR